MFVPQRVDSDLAVMELLIVTLDNWLNKNPSSQIIIVLTNSCCHAIVAYVVTFGPGSSIRSKLILGNNLHLLLWKFSRINLRSFPLHFNHEDAEVSQHLAFEGISQEHSFCFPWILFIYLFFCVLVRLVSPKSKFVLLISELPSILVDQWWNWLSKHQTKHCLSPCNAREKEMWSIS